MAKFTRLIEESNPDAPRYVANIGKYILGDALQELGLEVQTQPYHPVLEFVSKEGVRFRVTIEEVAPEAGEEEETDEGGLEPEEVKTLNMARQFATKPKGGFLGMNTPQGKMDKAYGDMMGKVSNKISNIARKI